MLKVLCWDDWAKTWALRRFYVKGFMLGRLGKNMGSKKVLCWDDWAKTWALRRFYVRMTGQEHGL